MGEYVLRYLSCLGMVLVATSVFAGESLVISEEDAFLDLYFDEAQVVEASTRIAKPITQVAENVTIISAADIERMNAHNIDDVLNRVAGVYVGYAGQDFNGNAFLQVQGSSYQQVAVYLDGVKISKATQDLSYTNVVPIRIVKRIEVIKGAASSTWGSALGGVINIITKDTGDSLRPTGSVQSSYGEFASQDSSVELAGRLSRLGYYLSIAKQKSDGLLDDKSYDNKSFYGKFDLELTPDMTLAVTGGYSDPEYKAGYFPIVYDYEEYNDDRNLFFTASFDNRLADNLNFHINGYCYNNDYNRNGFAISDGSVLWNDTDKQKSKGFNGRLNWSLTNQEIVAGVDYLRNDLKMYDELAATPPDQLDENMLAYYINDTIRLGNLTLIPGLRLDTFSEISDVLSPSLGATYLLTSETLLRASISRGFRKPPVVYTDEENGAWYANKDLDSELVWSYQVGIETAAAKFCRLKTTLYFHDANDAFEWSSTNWVYENSGQEERMGFEVEVETLPWYDLTVAINYNYNYQSDIDNEHAVYQEANLIFTYNNPDIAILELSGHYVNYGEIVANPDYNPQDGTFIWELSASKTIWQGEILQTDFFVVGHNLTNDSQFADEILKNNPRWLEAGLRFRF